MSTKQFISAEEHLAKLGVSVQQALDFINANIGQPEVIFAAARFGGVTNGMLSEITNFSTNVISDYFSSAGFNSIEFDYTSRLINSNADTLESLINFNDNTTGILSNTSLRDMVKIQLIEPLVYDFTFDPVYPEFDPNDGFYDAQELGVGHLVGVPATNDSVESLFYGSLINIFSSLDQSELNQITVFPDESDPEGFQALLLGALSESPSPVIWTDEQLGELVIEEAAEIINKFWSGETELVGILDHSFIGLSTA